MIKIIKELNPTIFIVLIILILISLGCHPRNLPVFKQMAEKADKAATERAKRLIEEDAEFKRIDKICREIPLLSDFNLIVMKALSNSKGISYFYTSSVDFDTAEKQFRQYFKDNQWKVLDHSSITRNDEFTKENYRVAIQYGNVGNADYSIHCGKWSPEDSK